MCMWKVRHWDSVYGFKHAPQISIVVNVVTRVTQSFGLENLNQLWQRIAFHRAHPDCLQSHFESFRCRQIVQNVIPLGTVNLHIFEIPPNVDGVQGQRHALCWSKISIICFKRWEKCLKTNIFNFAHQEPPRPPETFRINRKCYTLTLACTGCPLNSK